jgi:hypothetical protein
MCHRPPPPTAPHRRAALRGHAHQISISIRFTKSRRISQNLENLEQSNFRGFPLLLGVCRSVRSIPTIQSGIAFSQLAPYLGSPPQCIRVKNSREGSPECEALRRGRPIWAAARSSSHPSRSISERLNGTLDGAAGDTRQRPQLPSSSHPENAPQCRAAPGRHWRRT